jgi:predicted nuclease of predicted toxin-antitoxin system
MKFLIDAQLPRRLAHQLRAAGLETTHTLDLPDGNRTTDLALITFAREVASAAAAVNGLASLDELRSLRSLRR